MIIRQAQSNLAYSRITDFIEGEPEALLVVEVIAETEPELMAKLERLEARVKREGLGYAMPRLIKPSDQAKVWDVRKAGLGLMMNVPGDAKPLPFVEDTAVSPEKLPQFVRRFDEIVQAHGTEAGYYGHASVGCLHIRPLINLKDSAEVDKMVSISDEISDLVLEYGGSLSGEHGDGLVRSPYNEKMFGGEIYDAFRDVKRAFDPEGIMNPGKIVDSPPMTESLRIGPEYKPIEIETAFAYKDEGSFAHAIEMCNGQGACREGAWRDDVPVVHGYAGRGTFHARAGERAARGDVGGAASRVSYERADDGGDGPVPRMQGVQGGVPVEC